MPRRFWLLFHRYAGLGMAVFLVIVGLTGSVLAFREPIEDWLYPTRDRVAVRTTPMLDPLALRERALALAPGLASRYVELKMLPDRAFTITLEPPPDPATGQPPQTGYLELKLDPYSGELIARGPPSETVTDYWPVTRDNVVTFIWQLHVQLAAGRVGNWILGVVALVWVIDCFVAFYLTLPLGPAKGRAPKGSDAVPRDVPPPSRMHRWRRAWRIRWPASPLRFNFDLHRAGGLWTWAALLMFAWTSGTFNLHSVFHPLNDLIFGKQPNFVAPPQDHIQWEPPVDLRVALGIGRRLMAEQARLHDFQVLREYYIAYSPQSHHFTFAVNGDPLFGGQDGTFIRFDAVREQVLDLHMPSGLHAAVTAREWMSALHMAAIWGWPYRTFVCLMGLVITALSGTGIYIWWRKRGARRGVPRCPIRDERSRNFPERNAAAEQRPRSRRLQ